MAKKYKKTKVVTRHGECRPRFLHSFLYLLLKLYLMKYFLRDLFSQIISHLFDSPKIHPLTNTEIIQGITRIVRIVLCLDLFLRRNNFITSSTVDMFGI